MEALEEQKRNMEREYEAKLKEREEELKRKEQEIEKLKAPNKQAFGAQIREEAKEPQDFSAAV